MNLSKDIVLGQSVIEGRLKIFVKKGSIESAIQSSQQQNSNTQKEYK